jgi:starch synthase
LNILLAASEAVPFCKTGGLADVVGALAVRLGDVGHEVCLFLPKYRGIPASAFENAAEHALWIPLGDSQIQTRLLASRRGKITVCFIDYPPFFDRTGIYGQDESAYPDNDARFALLSRGALEGAKVLGFSPDVVHAHDWQGGLIPAYLKRLYAQDAFFSRAASVFTVHNMAYQGNFPRTSLSVCGFGPEDFTPEGLEYYGQVGYLKAGLVWADFISTVSPTYAREIQESSERGFGLEGLLSRRSAEFVGILNGIDEKTWNPRTDPHLPRSYGASNFRAGKAACRAALSRECGLNDDDSPLISIISRLAHQKGLDLAIEAVEPKLGACRLVVVGAGDGALGAAFHSLAGRHPGRVHFRAAFDDPFAHLAYAAGDFFLMPSRFEPCGLGQMIALRYGSVPIATSTGGLVDTVFESAQEGRPANGFLARPGDLDDLSSAIDRALAAFKTDSWPDWVRAAMESKFSWNDSVKSYLELYERARRKIKK